MEHVTTNLCSGLMFRFVPDWMWMAASFCSCTIRWYCRLASHVRITKKDKIVSIKHMNVLHQKDRYSMQTEVCWHYWYFALFDKLYWILFRSLITFLFSSLFHPSFIFSFIFFLFFLLFPSFETFSFFILFCRYFLPNFSCSLPSNLIFFISLSSSLFLRKRKKNYQAY